MEHVAPARHRLFPLLGRQGSARLPLLPAAIGQGRGCRERAQRGGTCAGGRAGAPGLPTHASILSTFTHRAAPWRARAGMGVRRALRVGGERLNGTDFTHVAAQARGLPPRAAERRPEEGRGERELAVGEERM